MLMEILFSEAKKTATSREDVDHIIAVAGQLIPKTAEPIAVVIPSEGSGDSTFALSILAKDTDQAQLLVRNIYRSETLRKAIDGIGGLPMTVTRTEDTKKNRHLAPFLIPQR